jgi:hypothetical protein
MAAMRQRTRMTHRILPVNAPMRNIEVFGSQKCRGRLTIGQQDNILPH